MLLKRSEADAGAPGPGPLPSGLCRIRKGYKKTRCGVSLSPGPVSEKKESPSPRSRLADRLDGHKPQLARLHGFPGLAADVEENPAFN